MPQFSFSILNIWLSHFYLYFDKIVYNNIIKVNIIGQNFNVGVKKVSSHFNKESK